MKRLIGSLVLSVLSMSLAQVMCEDILESLNTQLETVTSVERIRQIKAGFIEVAYIHERYTVNQSGNSTIETLEQRGRQIPNENPEIGLLPVENLDCEGSSVRQLDDLGYALDLLDSDLQTPMEAYTLEVSKDYQLEHMSFQLKVNALMTATIEVVYQMWIFK